MLKPLSSTTSLGPSRAIIWLFEEWEIEAVYTEEITNRPLPAD